MNRAFLLRLSWPSSDLSANGRVHWAKRAKATKAYRKEAGNEALARGVICDPQATLTFEFYPPDRRRRDAHNLPHMMKPAIDGIADAMGCDDNEFQCVFPSTFQDPLKGGAVLVTVAGRGTPNKGDDK